jgi:hypothetical protein
MLERWQGQEKCPLGEKIKDDFMPLFDKKDQNILLFVNKFIKSGILLNF